MILERGQSYLSRFACAVARAPKLARARSLAMKARLRLASLTPARLRQRPAIKRAATVALSLVLVTLLGTPNLTANKTDKRQLWMYNIHTKETVNVLFKQDGKYIPSAIKKLNWFMRDWRRKTPTKMDKRLFDLLWELHTELGSKKPIHLISGYRSPRTNARLRKTRGGQAKRSRHMYGQATDVHFPDVPIKRLRYSALIREIGGVGYYPTSAIPFIHVDTGRVRHWPRMKRYEMALLFKGRSTKHRPPDGRPISRKDYKVARTRYAGLARQVAAYHDLRANAFNRPTTLVASNDTGTRPTLTPTTRRQQPTFKQPARPTRVAALAPPRPKLLRGGFDFAQRTKPAPQRRVQMAAIRPSFDPAKSYGTTASDQVAALISKNPVPKPRDLQPSSGHITAIPTPTRPEPERGLIARARDALTAKIQQLTRMASLGTPTSDAPRYGLLTDGAPKDDSRLVELGGKVGNSRSRARTEPEIVTPKTRQIAKPKTAAAPREDFKRYNRNIAKARVEMPTIENDWSNNWVQAPGYDEEHPDELSYRPFEIAPLLVAASSDAPIFETLVHPDQTRKFDLIDSNTSRLPMKFRPGLQHAQLLWANQFKGQAVKIQSLMNRGPRGRRVKTARN